MENSAIGRPLWLHACMLITFWSWCARIMDNYNTRAFRDPQLSKWNQSRWPANCISGFHSHCTWWEKSQIVTSQNFTNLSRRILPKFQWTDISTLVRRVNCKSAWWFYQSAAVSRQFSFGYTLKAGFVPTSWDFLKSKLIRLCSRSSPEL